MIARSSSVGTTRPRSLATTRYYVMDAASEEARTYGSSAQGYTEAQYRRLLEANGFEDIAFLAHFGGDAPGDFVVVVATAAR